MIQSIYSAKLITRLVLFSCIIDALMFIPSEVLMAAPHRPNVLLIISEDTGLNLGCYGDKFVTTPNLDRLAEQGMRFTRASVVTASCSESRAGLLTGLYPHQNGQIGLATHHYQMFGKLPNMASRLKALGYRTGLIGKLHVNPESAFPFDFRPNVSSCNTFSHRDVKRVAEIAGEFFSENNTPFFLMVNYADTHKPFLRQQIGIPRSPLSADEVRPLPWIGIDNPHLRESQANYYNCIMRLDDGIGRLLSTLDHCGKSQNTIVIYLGDHGPQFPRGKLASYEPSLNIPLIIRFPGHIPTRQVRDQLVSSLDLLPTIIDAVGAPAPQGLPGRSLLQLIAQKQDIPWREYLFTEYHGHYPPLYFPQRTVRSNRYKLIVNLLQDRVNPVAMLCSQEAKPPSNYVTPEEIASADEHVRQAYKTWKDAPRVELYDLMDDPQEWRNRADDPSLADVKSRLLAELRHWQKQTSDPLANNDNLEKLTAEHDAIGKPYQKPKKSPWRYKDYLAPKQKEK